MISPETNEMLKERARQLDQQVARRTRQANLLLAAGAALVLAAGGFFVGQAAAPEKAPEACLVAIDTADKVFATTGSSLNRLNASSLRSATQDILEMGTTYRQAKDECRGAK